MRSAFDVSVVVPTYQGARFLPACLDSIAAQDLEGVEVVVVDDASSDGSVEVVRSYSDRIEHLRVLVGDQRLGAVGNLNRGIEAARGAWIKPVFQDDLIAPTNLSTMRGARRQGVPVVVCGRTYTYDEDVPSWRREACQRLLDESLVTRFGAGHLAGAQVAWVAKDLAARHLPHLNFVAEPVAVLVERRAVLRSGGFDPGYVQLWDYELVLRLAVRRGLVLVDEPLASFHVHEGSETARNFSEAAFRANVVDRLRLHVAYATERRYRPVRRAARRDDPSVDLVALAVGVARAGRRLADELPADERAVARMAIDDLAGRLPDVPVWTTADSAEQDLVQELSTRPEPVASPHPDGDEDGGPPEPRTDGSGGRRRPGVGTILRTVVRRPGWVATRAARALRTNQWWGHMMGPIVAFACLQIGWRQIPPGQGMVRVLALVASAVALAGYGYIVNDAADVIPDRSAGKPNSMARFPAPARLVVIVSFAALGAVPWLFLSLDTPARAVLAGIYLVPILYSVAPIRLKERHLLGPLADAANAFVLPALFTIALFAPLGDPTGPPGLMVAGTVLWTTGFGLRAIIKHQVDDAANDRASGTTTLVLKVGEVRARQVMRRVLFPMELVGMILLAVTVVTWSWAPVAVGVAYALVFHALRLGGMIDRGTSTVPLEQGGWMYWHQIWPALMVSLALAVGDLWYAVLAASVVLMFWGRVRSGIQTFTDSVSAEWCSRRAAQVGPGRR